MAKVKYSKKGKHPAKSEKTDGGVSPKGQKGTAKAPPPPASGNALTKKAVMDFLRKQGADKDLVDSVGRLQRRATPTSSSPNPKPDRKPTSAQALVKLIVAHVQHERQMSAWDKVPTFLSEKVHQLVASIRPPGGPNEAFMKAVRVHGDDFCHNVQLTTRLHIGDHFSAVRRSLASWKDLTVTEEAEATALRRLNKVYGKKVDADKLPELIKSAMTVIPARDGSWNDQVDMEEDAAAGTSSSHS